MRVRLKDARGYDVAAHGIREGVVYGAELRGPDDGEPGEKWLYLLHPCQIGPVGHGDGADASSCGGWEPDQFEVVPEPCDCTHPHHLGVCGVEVDVEQTFDMSGTPLLTPIRCQCDGKPVLVAPGKERMVTEADQKAMELPEIPGAKSRTEPVDGFRQGLIDTFGADGATPETAIPVRTSFDIQAVIDRILPEFMHRITDEIIAHVTPPPRNEPAEAAIPVKDPADWHLRTPGVVRRVPRRLCRSDGTALGNSTCDCPDHASDTGDPNDCGELGCCAVPGRDVPADGHGANTATTKDTNPNPKDAIGSTKLPLHLVPPLTIAYASLGHLNGLLKYGAWNWRKAGVRCSIYAAALKRHADAFAEGEEYDPDDGVPHLSAALACIGIILDARACGKLTDDRAPANPGYRAEIAKLTAHVKRLQALHAAHSPRHFTIADTDECFGRKEP